jgi:hypothetical protein
MDRHGCIERERHRSVVALSGRRPKPVLTAGALHQQSSRFKNCRGRGEEDLAPSISRG